MTGAERGYLLLCSHLGNPERKPLTIPQLRRLSQRMKAMSRPETDRELTSRDFIALGYSREEAMRVLALLSEDELLEYYLAKARKHNCFPITRVSPAYPRELKQRLGDAAPGCLWAMGDMSVLTQEKISLVGSRELHSANERFTREAGLQAARQGYALVSGNARGADKIAQNSALKAGGKIISVVADGLIRRNPEDNILYLSEDAFDAGFSAQRALSRNRIIHALGQKVLVSQCSLEKGGTWAGTTENLTKGYSPVFCYDDGSEAASALNALGADLVTVEQLGQINKLQASKLSFL